MVYFRSIIGDGSDNIGGVEGYGKSFVNKILPIFEENDIELKDFDDCINFYKSVVNKVKEGNYKKSDKIVKLSEKISQLIDDSLPYVKQWKTSWEISDIRHSYDTLPSYALETLLKLFENKKEYVIKEFLEEIIKYEFDSIDDYKKWVAIFECLNDGEWGKLQSRAGVGWYKMINMFNIISEKVDNYYNKLETKENDDFL